MYKTIIIEDDPMVSSINRQYLTGNPQLTFLQAFSNGKDALAYCEKNQVDLAVIDYYMPLMNGLDFIRACRERQLQLDFIMITAANQAEDIAACMQLGAVDYLIKPFTYERFQTAVNRFLSLKESLNSEKPLTQAEIDQLLSLKQSSSAAEPALEKGLQRNTLQLIREYFQNHNSTYFSNDEIAKEVGLSRITVRRYVNYLMDTGLLVSSIDYETGGRPSIRYKYRT